MSVIDNIQKHTPAWEGHTEDGTTKRIYAIIGDISDEESESESDIESSSDSSDEDSE